MAANENNLIVELGFNEASGDAAQDS